MEAVQLLTSIRPALIARVTEKMAGDEALRADFREEVQRFFLILSQILETGDPTWVDAQLAAWAASQTQTDMEAAPSTLLRFLKDALLVTSQTAQEMLSGDEALALISALQPAFAHAYEVAAMFEMQIKMAHLSTEMGRVQQSLQKLDRSKSGFIAIAAHELKTPLTLVDGYTAMLRESLETLQKDSLQSQLIEGIHNGTRRLKAIIDDMIDVSMIDNNMLSLNFQPLWLNRLLHVLRLELEPSIRERSQTLEFCDFDGSDEMIFGDPERLLQALRNVLTNAIKFTPDAGQICVNGRKLPGFLEITISDTGIGIAQEDQSTIFERFSRLGNTALHSTSKSKFKGGGPGLGLHITRGIIEAHGGAIWVESSGYDEQATPGATFHLLLPARKTPPDDTMTRLFTTSNPNITQTEENQT